MQNNLNSGNLLETGSREKLIVCGEAIFFPHELYQSILHIYPITNKKKQRIIKNPKRFILYFSFLLSQILKLAVAGEYIDYIFFFFQ